MKYNMAKVFERKKTILISGQTGVGKSCFARKLHENHQRKGTPFINVNLASLTESLFESQLFGHVRGAFTGAVEGREGFVAKAKSGTLFLDEVGELSLPCQQKLLELLEEREYCAVGSQQKIKFHGMIIAATNQNLEQMVKEQKFRSDLYYRLKVVVLNLTPLAMQREQLDLPLRSVRSLMSKRLFDYLRHDYSWPGNFRELKYFIERLELSLHDELWDICDFEGTSGSSSSSLKMPCSAYYEALEDFERKYFSQMMVTCRGRVNFAAQRLGISKSTLIAKLKKYGINSLQIKASSQSAQEALAA